MFDFRLHDLTIVSKNYKFTFIIFFVVIAIFTYMFSLSKEEKIETFNQSLQTKYEFQLKAIEKNFYNLAQNTFFGIINKPVYYSILKEAIGKDEKTKNILREELLKAFSEDYSRLLNYQFTHVHFHFANNESFLRIHDSKNYGDDLTNIRYSVKKTNQDLKPYQGFEIGIEDTAYRFVFPLFDEQLLHIGSVEISVYAKAFESSFEENNDIDAHFLYRIDKAKQKINNDKLSIKKISDENDQYYLLTESNNEELHFSSKGFYSKSELLDISKKMDDGVSFVLTKQYENSSYSISFFPLKNVQGINNLAYLVLYNKAPFIEQVQYSYYKLLMIMILLTVIFIFVMLKKNEIDQKNKQKDLLLTQQSKMASMGEMIGNIAHQWRQPLSVISTASTGLKVQKEYGILTDEMFYDNVDRIYQSTQYLSQTIDDFRNFFNNSKKKEEFLISEVIEKSLNIFGASFKNNNIDVIENIDEISLVTYSNELKQVIINLLKNAKDAIGKQGVILVSASEKGDIVTIKVQDSAGGVPEDIKQKIFEPYFTTKHQSVGTGIGLFMSHEIIRKSMNGTLSVMNENFIYNFKDYFGACFVITLNKKDL